MSKLFFSTISKVSRFKITISTSLIENKEKWNLLAVNEFSITKINQQSDLYLYYLIHTSAFLKEGGMLGYVISSSWLDTVFGGDLQKFLLDHFKIIAIIDNQKKRNLEFLIKPAFVLFKKYINGNYSRLIINH